MLTVTESINKIDNSIHLVSEIINNLDEIRTTMGEKDMLEAIRRLLTEYDYSMLELHKTLNISIDQYEKRRRNQNGI